ncbi:MAG TPA: carbamoyltransferase N-terminal domain-containing protein [Kofleriaceae bacterium]|nr:carbamoyltransferase N-terminal domain-containing protein [Kofleriaceae bacterium]
MNVLGISAFYHDSAAALVVGGRLVAASQEERYTRVKFDHRVPVNAARAALDSQGLTIRDVDLVCFYEQPLVKLDRIVASLAMRMGAEPKALASSLREKLAPQDILKHALCFDGEVRCFPHHLCHAASAFLTSPFEEAGILTMDGVGEWTTTGTFLGTSRGIKPIARQEYPHSLGLFYSAITSFLGFTPNSDEYKVMGLAAYGRPRFLDKLRNVMRWDARGMVELSLEYFDFNFRMFSPALEDLFGVPRRSKRGPITKDHRDIAASAQRLCEEAVLALANRLHADTGVDRLCLAGGVALNCVANARLRNETAFKHVFVQPAAGDAGGAVGAAMLGAQRKRRPLVRSPMRHAYLGPEFSDAQIETYVRRMDVVYQRLSSKALVERVAEVLDSGRIVGWFQGRMEWGPRALGARSILADPRPATMKGRLNAKIKMREGFRPFAPICLWSRASEFFDVGAKEPFMTFTVGVKRPEVLGAVTHADRTARLQTVDDDAGLLADLLRAFAARTGVPVLVNTSFNVNGEPIVCTPLDAFNCFRETGIDVLVMGHILIDKAEQPPRSMNPGTHAFISVFREHRPHERDTYFFT